MAGVTLLTGGARSGKSRRALDIASAYERRGYIATAEVCDAEMEARIEAHRKERGDSFRTVEEPIDPAGALERLAGYVDVVVIDCLTVWLGNLLHRESEGEGPIPEVRAFLDAIVSPPCDLVIVTNEVGMGIVPLNALARRFRDEAGTLNREVACLADTVILMVSGIPVTVKDNLHG